MKDALDGVRDHYRATGLTERLKSALTAFGPEDQPLTPLQLAGLDQFHTRGLAATAELAGSAGITAAMSVLDVGSGVGGPARFLAATYGCRVTGIDIASRSWMPHAILPSAPGRASRCRSVLPARSIFRLPTTISTPYSCSTSQ